MQENKSASDKMIRKLEIFGINRQSPVVVVATDEKIRDMLEGFEKIRDNMPACFVVTLMQSQK